MPWASIYNTMVLGAAGLMLLIIPVLFIVLHDKVSAVKGELYVQMDRTLNPAAFCPTWIWANV